MSEVEVNTDEFIKSLEKATLKIVEETAKNMQKAVKHLEGEAVKEAPIDEGQLRASMFSDVEFDDKAITGYVANSVHYAPYVHNGTGIYAKDGNGRKTPWRYTVKRGKYAGTHWTVGQKPKPFLENAKQKNIDKIEQMLGGG